MLDVQHVQTTRQFMYIPDRKYNNSTFEKNDNKMLIK